MHFPLSTRSVWRFSWCFESYSLCLFYDVLWRICGWTKGCLSCPAATINTCVDRWSPILDVRCEMCRKCWDHCLKLVCVCVLTTLSTLRPEWTCLDNESHLVEVRKWLWFLKFLVFNIITSNYCIRKTKHMHCELMFCRSVRVFCKLALFMKTYFLSEMSRRCSCKFWYLHFASICINVQAGIIK